MLIRPARPSDALAVARVHVGSWQAAYRSLLPDDYLDSLQPEDRAPHYDFTHSDPQKPHTLVAEHEGVIGGFATTMPSSDPTLPAYAELCALYVSPALWNTGIGRALILAAREHMCSQGFTSAALWLLKGNSRADRFYRRDGWLPDGACKSDRLWGIDVEEARYLRPLP